MNGLIVISGLFASIFLVVYIINKVEEVKERRNYRKWERASAVNSYRIQITCNNIITVKTFAGDSYSEILEKAINYSLEEMDDFPDVIVLKKDIIYL